MNHGLEQAEVDRIRTVFADFREVEKAVLYGSRAKGDFKPGSDIDLTLFGSGLNAGMVGCIAEQLDDLLLPYRFDLSIFNRIVHPDLVEHIRRVGVTFYERMPVTTGGQERQNCS
jgi:predicted nucleotidyltransferase